VTVFGENDLSGEYQVDGVGNISMPLTVYCTSWTFFGAVGTAASSGWNYVPIYLGPAMVFLVLPGLVKRIGDITQRESISSLSDFLAARYGKSRALAATATLAAIAGSVPYIALQLKSVATSFDALTLAPSDLSGGGARSTVLMTTVALGAFAILFGTRHADTTRKNTGLMHVLAFEAIVKLVALITVAILALALVG
ncbi:MAG: hybrid sensor histidine kinase/response regulator, partial [Pseudomonadota bacterium]